MGVEFSRHCGFCGMDAKCSSKRVGVADLRTRSRCRFLFLSWLPISKLARVEIMTLQDVQFGAVPLVLSLLPAHQSKRKRHADGTCLFGTQHAASRLSPERGTSIPSIIIPSSAQMVYSASTRATTPELRPAACHISTCGLYHGSATGAPV